MTPLLTALFDRWRGEGFGTLWMAAYAGALAYELAPDDFYAIAAIIVGLILTERPGWGAPIGQFRGDVDPNREPEWYQRWFGGFMWRHPFIALVFRGFLWGAGALPAMYFEPRAWVITAAFTVAFPLAEVIAKYKPDPPWPKSWAGAWNEFYRGALVGMIVMVLA